jgi:hypothetical protein
MVWCHRGGDQMRHAAATALTIVKTKLALSRK